MNDYILNKTLKAGLVGLQRRIDRLDETKITKELTDCFAFILIETARIDSEVEK